jgi:endoglucanase
VETDVHGSVHGVLNPDAAVRVMLCGHCDEIGLMVQHIDDKGYVYVSALGGVNVPLLPAERVVIFGKKGAVPGVIGVKPIHVKSDKDKNGGPSKIHELWVDIGAKDKKDAERAVSLGDVGTIDAGWIDLRNGRVSCRGFDDRLGAFVVADVLRLLHGKKLNVALHAVSTVQEEVGLRGAKTAAFKVDPQIGIAVDVGFATDYPEMNEKMLGAAALGGGPVLHRGPTFNHEVLDLLQKTAKRKKIKTQMQPEPRGANTDAFALQMTRSGVAAGLISIATRYIHSPVETASVDDVASTVKLLAGFVSDLTGRERLVPALPKG